MGNIVSRAEVEHPKSDQEIARELIENKRQRSEKSEKLVKFSETTTGTNCRTGIVSNISIEDEDDNNNTSTRTNRNKTSAGSTNYFASHSSSISLQAKGLRSNLMREQKNRDPLFYYEIIQVLGVGSMGSVSMVRKRDEIIGGSARKNLVDSFRRQRRNDDCFQIPVVGDCFRFCIEATATNVNDSRHNNNSILQILASSDDVAVSSPSTRSTGMNYSVTYALKSIHLNRVTDLVYVEELKNEVEILKSLDHPHVVRPIETFLHRNQMFIVMEICTGGDLYSRDPYTEEEAARIVSSMLSAVAYMHSRNIVHRDLKYENILFVNDSPRSDIKLIDFGLSKKYAPDKELTEGVGTIYTMAPEVLRGTYSSQADLWSLGVITYMLLSSQMPFYGRKRRHIVEQIMQCQFDFKGRRWKRVSQEAKSFVEGLLVLNPEERANAEAALLKSPWLQNRRATCTRGPSMDEMDQTAKSLVKFSEYSHLKKLALMVIAHKSTSEEIGVLRKVFESYDKRRDGIIRRDEFHEAMAKYGYKDDDVDRMFAAVDLDGTGMIRYTEFLAATIEARGVIDEERLAEAFDRLDSDDSGFISAANLTEILGEDFCQETIAKIIGECDLTEDQRISYPEFLALWEEQNGSERTEMHRRASAKAEDDFTEEELASKVMMRQDSEADLSTLARTNFIEGKKHSERKMEEAQKVDATAATKIILNTVDEIVEDPDLVNALVSNDAALLDLKIPPDAHKQ